MLFGGGVRAKVLPVRLIGLASRRKGCFAGDYDAKVTGRFSLRGRDQTSPLGWLFEEV